jgi:hypothetical protein
MSRLASADVDAEVLTVVLLTLREYGELLVAALVLAPAASSAGRGRSELLETLSVIMRRDADDE